MFFLFELPVDIKFKILAKMSFFLKSWKLIRLRICYTNNKEDVSNCFTKFCMCLSFETKK